MVDFKGLLPKKEKDEHYWSVVLEKDWVQAGIWKVSDGKVDMISVSPPASWGTADELVNAADSALSSSVSELGDDAPEPSKTVFAVPNSWSSDGQIKQDYLDQIKEICQKLELSPVGFVVLPEAIAHYLKAEEGASVSAILIGLGKEELDLSLVRSGKIIGTTQVLRSVSLDADVTEGVARITDGQGLPSRLVLYDGKEGELEEARQTLIDVDWTKHPEIAFLHSPKIETIKSKDKVFATALAGGAEIAGAASVLQDTASSPQVTPNVENVSDRLVENDIDPLSLEQTGFVVNQDVSAQSYQEPKEVVHNLTQVDRQQQEASFPTEQFSDKPKSGLVTKLTTVVSGIKTKVNKILGRSGASKVALFGGGFIVLFIVIGFFAWWFLPKAQVTVYISPNKLEERIEIFVNPNVTSVNMETKTLPGQVLSAEEEGSRTASTTGSKTVGDKAKGTVKLYRVGSAVSLDAGETLESAGGLVFVLDNDISIASGSASSPSTQEAAVTASAIGSDSNLASGASFSVSNYPTSELEAKNESDFGGGSSREISAVSESDLEDLLVSLQKELEDKAKEQFKKTVEENLVSENTCGDGCVFIEDSVMSTVTDRTYSNIAGDEATTLKLDLKVEVTGLIVDKKSLLEVAKETFQEKIPTGYVLRNDQIGLEFELEDESDGIYSLSATVAANLLPELNIEEIKKVIAGKDPEDARETLSAIPGFERIEIVLTPHFPGRLGILPKIVKNIEVEVAAEK